jgi:uncharacterized membrane protein YhdT
MLQQLCKWEAEEMERAACRVLGLALDYIKGWPIFIYLKRNQKVFRVSFVNGPTPVT